MLRDGGAGRKARRSHPVNVLPCAGTCLSGVWQPKLRSGRGLAAKTAFRPGSSSQNGVPAGVEQQKRDCFDGVHPCFDGVHPCFDGVHPCFDGVHPCFDGVHPCFDGVHPCQHVGMASNKLWCTPFPEPLLGRGLGCTGWLRYRTYPPPLRDTEGD
eukprot:gene17518-biopygen2334